MEHSRTPEGVRLVHRSEGNRAVLATDVETADSWLRQARGLMFRRTLPPAYALVFRFDRVSVRDVHMLFVFTPLDVLWLVDGEVRRVERLAPFRGFARAECDTIVELPPGSADDVTVGDRITIEERPSGRA